MCIRDRYKWCDYDYMAVWIRSKNYTPKTTMENLIEMIFAHYDRDVYKRQMLLLIDLMMKK